MSGRDKILAVLIFIYFLIFEVIYFVYSDFFSLLGPGVTLFKIFFPAVFFVYVGVKHFRAIESDKLLKNFIFFFTLFLLWGFIVSFVAGIESILEWLKYIPRYLFFVSTAIFFRKQPGASGFVLKCIVVWSCMSVVQYAFMEIFKIYDLKHPYPFGYGMGAGPYGLFGNISSNPLYIIPSHPFYRLSGFWLEPSKASAVLYASFFLAQYLGLCFKKKYWHRVGIICLIGGFLSLSNAGNLALGGALLIGALLSFRKNGLMKIVLPGAIAFIFIFLALFGRTFVARYIPDSGLARAIFGVHGDISSIAVDLNYAYDGRIASIQDAISLVSANPIGIGFMHHKFVENLSGSSLVLWYVFSGVPGIIFLLLREVWLWLKIRVAGTFSQEIMLLGQAYCVIAIQQLSYGDWMSPLYLIIIATIFAASANVKDNRF